MKKMILKVALVFVFLLCLVLNIVLLCTPVFRGTYSNDKMSMTFYENTYTTRYQERKGMHIGFYAYNKNINNKNYVMILDNVNEDIINEHALVRESVFCLDVSSYTYKQDEKLYCKPAIALQVIYPVVGVASIVSFVVIQLKDKKKAQKITFA